MKIENHDLRLETIFMYSVISAMNSDDVHSTTATSGNFFGQQWKKKKKEPTSGNFF